MSSQSILKTEYQDGQGISIPCFGLSVVLFLVLGVLPALPSRVTMLFRPIVIFLCIFFPGGYTYRISQSAKALILFHLYLTAIFLSHPITSERFMSWASMVLFAAFFVTVTHRTWSTREIRFILQVIMASCFVYSLFLLRENTHLFRGSIGEDVTFFGTHVNPNAAAFGIVPGALFGIFFLVYSKPNNSKGSSMLRVWYLGVTALSFIMLVGLGGRSAFFSALIGSVLIVWEWGEAIRTSSNRIAFRVFLVLMLLTIYCFGPIWTEGTHAYRLFDYDNLTSMNGRDDMAKVAIGLINENPFFGGGFGYWDFKTNKSLMVHNTFLADGVWGGYTAIILLGFFFLFAALELIQSRSLVPIAFFVEALFHSMTEPGMDYYAYIPLTMAFILCHYVQSHNCMPRKIAQT